MATRVDDARECRYNRGIGVCCGLIGTIRNARQPAKEVVAEVDATRFSLASANVRGIGHGQEARSSARIRAICETQQRLAIRVHPPAWGQTCLA